MDRMTLTPYRVALVLHANVTRITERHPHLTRIYWFLTNLDAALHREWALSLAQHSAMARAAAPFCEPQIRLEIAGLAGLKAVADFDPTYLYLAKRER